MVMMCIWAQGLSMEEADDWNVSSKQDKWLMVNQSTCKDWPCVAQHKGLPHHASASAALLGFTLYTKRLYCMTPQQPELAHTQWTR